MLRFPAVVTSLGLLTGSVLAVHTAPAPRPVEQPIGNFLQSLGSPDYAERETATRELDRIGPPALPELHRLVSRSTDGEVLRRGQQLIARLEKRLADEKALAPTLVEVNAEQKTVEDIVADLSKQSGYAVTLTADRNRESKTITLKTGRVSFWNAIEKLCDTADLQIASVGGVTAPISRAAQTPTGAPGTSEIPAPVGVRAPADALKAAMAKLETVKRDLERIAQARKEVAKEVNATAKARAAALEAIQAAAQARLKDAEREVALARAQAQNPVPGPAPKPIARQVLPARGQSSQTNSANVIVLEPRIGAKRPSANFGAVRIESFPMPESAAVPDAVATLIQVWVEPRIQWQQTRGIRVRQARDEHGQALVTDPAGTVATGPVVVDGNGIQMVQNVNGGVVIINNGGGRVVINGNINGKVIVNNGNVVIQGVDQTAQQPNASFPPNPRSSVVKFLPGDKSTGTLKEFQGVLEAIVRTGPEAIVTVEDLSKASERSHPGGVKLSTSAITKQDDGSYTLDVTIEYNPNLVQVAAPAGEVSNDAMAPLPLRRGLVIRNGGRNGFGASGKVVHGLTATDANGKRYAIQAESKGAMHNGTTVASKLTLKLTPPSKDDPAPQSLAFWGIRSATVDIPFRLAEVAALSASK